MTFIRESLDDGSEDQLKCWYPEFLHKLGKDYKNIGIDWTIDRERDIFREDYIMYKLIFN